MKPLEPPQTRFDLRWRLGRVPVRVTPLFWFSSAILGIRYYADPDGGSLGYFVFWMAAVFASVLLHDTGHVLAARLFDMRGEVVLFGLGGVTLGIEELPRRRQRLLVLLAGPLISLLVVAAVWGITCVPFPQILGDWGWRSPIANGIFILFVINLGWALLNLLPLLPLDGGRMACEIGEGIFGRRGRTAAVVLSIVCAGVLALGLIFQLSWRLSFRFDPRYLIYLGEDSVLLLYAFLFWLRGFGELWPAK